MADVQDDDQWLYGDEKDDPREDGEINDRPDDDPDDARKENEQDRQTSMEEGSREAENEKDGEDKGDKEKEGEKEAGEKGDDDDSSDDDDLTITIGVIKTQPDIIQAPTAPHAARFQPKAAPNTGLKDDDFTSPGKINGVPMTEFNLADLEDKPWRKPGADISDYFNYGFNEETWFKYCERQKRMRISESGAGLTGLGISVTKPFGNAPNSIPVTIVNDNSKYGGTGTQRPKAGPPPRNKMGQIDVIGGTSNPNKPSTIQVMTADRREYSNKVMMNGPPPPLPPPNQPGYNDMEFGGNPYGDSYYSAETPFYGGPGFETPPPWGPGGQPPIPGQNNWEGPGGGPPNVTQVSSGTGYFEEESVSAPPAPSEPEEERHRSRRNHRSRSRSPTRHRHSSRHPRSRSRSPSHRHKRKKSKRERDTD